MNLKDGLCGMTKREAQLLILGQEEVTTCDSTAWIHILKILSEVPCLSNVVVSRWYILQSAATALICIDQHQFVIYILFLDLPTNKKGLG